MALEVSGRSRYHSRAASNRPRWLGLAAAAKRETSLPMAKITFIQPDGSRQEVVAEPGMTVMEAARKELVPGIEAECGGACSCATCHVYVEETWREKVGPPSQMEEDMLDFAFDVRESSRLSCQIKVSEELDGLVVSVPEKQF
jgi:2Fe-2S ferredoxin